MKSSAEITAWVVRELERTGKTQAELARALKRNRSSVTRIIQGKRGSFTTVEVALMKEFFGSPESDVSFEPDFRQGLIMVQGRVGDIWSAPDPVMEPDRIQVRHDDDYPFSEQFAYRIDGPTEDGEFKAGDYVVAVKFPNEVQSRRMAGDTYIIRRQSPSRQGLESYTLKRAVSRNGELVLTPLFEPTNGDYQETIVGIVIDMVRRYKRS